jgi:hypothetical protein
MSGNSHCCDALLAPIELEVAQAFFPTAVQHYIPLTFKQVFVLPTLPQYSFPIPAIGFARRWVVWGLRLWRACWLS